MKYVLVLGLVCAAAWGQAQMGDIDCQTNGSQTHCSTYQYPTKPAAVADPLGSPAVQMALLEYMERRRARIAERSREREQVFNDYWQRISTARREGDYATALAWTIDALHVLRGDPFFKRVRKQIQEDLRVDSDPRTHYAAAERLMIARKYSDAIVQYERTLELFPQNPTVEEHLKIAKEALEGAK